MCSRSVNFQQHPVLLGGSRYARGFTGRIRLKKAADTANCFPAGTPVRTAAGLVAIDAIRPGTLVLSRDERTGETSLKRVVRTMVHRATELVHVRTADGTIAATPNHPFRVAGRGWVAAGDLSAGDTLYLADGGRASILSVTREKLASPLDVYNLEVEDFHTYFVASTGIWVHNCGGEAANSPVFRSDTSHIFRDAAGHLVEDTPASRALLQDAIRPENLVRTIETPQGDTIGTFRQVLMNGQQVWVEVRNGVEITNGGVNATPR